MNFEPNSRPAQFLHKSFWFCQGQELHAAVPHLHVPI